MRAIRKGRPPSSFIEYAKSSGATYDSNLLPKAELRAALVHEQGGLCCYCMAKIRGTELDTRIEHWAPQSLEPGLQLEYGNLLAACNGGAMPRQRVRLRFQHCDRKKGDDRISLDPRLPSTHPKRLRYEGGQIKTDDSILMDDIEERLNLNVRKLRGEREDALQNFIGEFGGAV